MFGAKRFWYKYNACGVRAQRVIPELEPNWDSEIGDNRDTYFVSKRHFNPNAPKPIELGRNRCNSFPCDPAKFGGPGTSKTVTMVNDLDPLLCLVVN